MITFYQSNYTLEELKDLEQAMSLTFMHYYGCNSHCDECPRKKPCWDISKFRNHLNTLINQKEGNLK